MSIFNIFTCSNADTVIEYSVTFIHENGRFNQLINDYFSEAACNMFFI